MTERTKTRATSNGATAEPSNGATSSLPVERAEKLVDDVAHRVGRFVSNLGLHVSRFAARAREEVEDIVAEAQSLRRGDSQH